MLLLLVAFSFRRSRPGNTSTMFQAARDRALGLGARNARKSLGVQMRQTRWGLLATAAALATVAAGAATAADLPVRKAAPVEYVRVCTAYGAGFFYIPGTDTCLRVGGRARFSYQYMSSRQLGPTITGVNAANSLVNRDNSAFQSLTFLNFDARSQTSYGTLRTFIRVIAAYSSGGYLTSGTAQRFGTA